MKAFFITLISMILSLGVMAETREVTLEVNPPMSCHNCENKIKENIRFVKGVTAVNPSVQDQKVVVKYNSDKTSVDKITAAFKKIGYTATEFDPKAEKKEKAECSGSCCSSAKKK